MAQLDASSCCSPSAQETCCEPDAKSECCGSGGGCGCAAGRSEQADRVRQAVEEKYASVALQVERGADGCGWGTAVLGGAEKEVFGSALYSGDERDELPEAAQLASLGDRKSTRLNSSH